MNNNINDYIADLEFVTKMRSQLKPEQITKLLTKFSEESIIEVLGAMENTFGIEKKYSSVYLTANTWLKRRGEWKKPEESFFDQL